MQQLKVCGAINKEIVMERYSSGNPLIFGTWREQGWVMPAVTEQLEPERTILTLTSEKSVIKNRR